MYDQDQTTKEWFYHHYLRYWYWLGTILLFVVLAGSVKPHMDYRTFLSFLLFLLLFLTIFGYYVYQRIWPESIRGPKDKIRALIESRRKRDREQRMEVEPQEEDEYLAPRDSAAREHRSDPVDVAHDEEGERQEPVIVSGRLGGHPPRRSEGSTSSRPGGRPDRLSRRRPPRPPYSSGKRRSRRSRRR